MNTLRLEKTEPIMMQLPVPLAKAFEDKVTITVGELCRLLPIDRKTLHRHIRAGHISWVQLGMGDRAVRRGFTLKAVMRFLEDRERIVSPPPVGRARRSEATSEGFLALRARIIAEKKRRMAADDPNDFMAQRALRVAERERANLQRHQRAMSRNEES